MKIDISIIVKYENADEIILNSDSDEINIQTVSAKGGRMVLKVINYNAFTKLLRPLYRNDEGKPEYVKIYTDDQLFLYFSEEEILDISYRLRIGEAHKEALTYEALEYFLSSEVTTRI